jgi:AmmeMemoRadiSam system protein B
MAPFDRAFPFSPGRGHAGPGAGDFEEALPHLTDSLASPFLLAYNHGCRQNLARPAEASPMDIRPSPIAGQWYPGQPQTLQSTVDTFLAAAAPVAPAEVVGLLVPHAGHRYSGAVAAHAFRAVQGLAMDVVVVMCPSHYHADGPVLTSAHEAYATPLGRVAVDRPALERLRAGLARALQAPPEQVLVGLRNDREHAIEIELPFLQRTLAPGFRLLPLMLRDQSPAMARALAAALAESLRGQRALLVASSDLSHHYPHPIARQLDAALLQRVAAFDPDGVLAVNAAGQGQACGSGVIAATLWAARELGATQARVVHHATSGEVNGDLEQVVGYAAGIMIK